MALNDCYLVSYFNSSACFKIAERTFPRKIARLFNLKAAYNWKLNILILYIKIMDITKDIVNSSQELRSMPLLDIYRKQSEYSVKIS